MYIFPFGGGGGRGTEMREIKKKEKVREPLRRRRSLFWGIGESSEIPQIFVRPRQMDSKIIIISFEIKTKFSSQRIHKRIKGIKSRKGIKK